MICRNLAIGRDISSIIIIIVIGNVYSNGIPSIDLTFFHNNNNRANSSLSSWNYFGDKVEVVIAAARSETSFSRKEEGGRCSYATRE